MECSDFFSTHEVIGSSLLFVHDRNQASVWLIDFAKTVVLPNNIKIDHGSIWSVGNHEDGYLIGINNLISIFEELQSCLESNQEANEESNQAANDELNHGPNQECMQVPNQESSQQTNEQLKPELNQQSNQQSTPESNLQSNPEPIVEQTVEPVPTTVPTRTNDEQLNNNSEKMCNLSIES